MKVVGLGGIIVTVSVLAGSCQQQPAVSTTRGTAAVECDETLLPVMRFQAEDFHNMYPEAAIQLRSVEAREAVVDFMNDSVRTIVLGRPFNKEELEYLKNSRIEYEGYRIAYDAIAVALHVQNPDTTMRITELDSIYSGFKTRWSTGKKQLVDAYTGNVNSSVDEVFRNHLGGKQTGPTITRLASSTMIVEEVTKNPNAIGLVGLSWLSGHEKDVRTARLGGGTYQPLTRASASIEGVRSNQQRIVITQPPRGTEGPAFVQRVKDLVGNKTIPRVSVVLDESTGERIRIALVLEDQTDADEVLNVLHHYTETPDPTLVSGQFFSPSLAHVVRKYYPLSRDVYVYTREVRRDVSYGFIAYVRDTKGQQNFINYGLAPATIPVRMVSTTAEKVQ